MSGATVVEFLAYWQGEGERYVRRGDYEWMAGLVPGQRVLEVGCGPGFGTQALLARGLVVLALEVLPECLAATRALLGDAHGGLTLVEADVAALDDAQFAQIERFAPDAMVCWLMGAPADTTGAAGRDDGQRVAEYRESVHRATAELAARLPSVRTLHFVDRTAIPWQAKDVGRETLVRYHSGKTLAGLPFVAGTKGALYRKLEGDALELAQLRRAYPAVKGVTAVLASLLAERTD